MKTNIKPSKSSFKKSVVNIGFILLGRGLESCSHFDAETKEELARLHEGFSFSLSVLPAGPSIALTVYNNKLKFAGLNSNQPTDLIITIKNLKTAFNMIITKAGTHKVYAEHKVGVKGRITNSLVVTRLMYRTQSLLFPKFLHKNILKKSPEFSFKRLVDMMHIYTLGILFKR